MEIHTFPIISSQLLHTLKPWVSFQPFSLQNLPRKKASEKISSSFLASPYRINHFPHICWDPKFLHPSNLHHHLTHRDPPSHLTSIRQRSFVACGCVAATIFDRLGGEVYGSRCRVQRTRPGTWRHRPRGGGCCSAVVVGVRWWVWNMFFLGDGGDADENDDNNTIIYTYIFSTL